MKVSIVIPTRDRPQLLRRCLEAVRVAVQGHPDIEVIVVDASPTGSARSTVEEFPRIVYVAEPAVRYRNQPGAAAAGARRAQGDIVCFLDDDAAPRPDWLEELLRLYAGEDIGGVGGRIALGPSPAPVRAFVDTAGRLDWSGFNSDSIAEEVDFLPGGNMSFRRDVLTRALEVVDLNRYRHGRNWRWETALCVGVRSMGYRLVYAGRATVDHSPTSPVRIHDPAVRFGLALNESLFAMDVRPGLRTVAVHGLVEPFRDLTSAAKTVAGALLGAFGSVFGRWAGLVWALFLRYRQTLRGGT